MTTKVLHVTPIYEPAWEKGGVVRAISQLCRGLSGLGLDVTVYTTDSSGDGWLPVPSHQPVDVGGVRVFYFHTPWPRKFRYSGALAQACRESIGHFDVVHLASFWNYPGIPAGLEARRQGVPYVISTHGTLISSALRQSRLGWLKKWLYLRAIEDSNLRGAAAIHYTSEIERETIGQSGWGPPTFVVPNGLDFREFDALPARDEARARLGLSSDALVVTFLGRLNPGKALDVLIQAFARVVRQLPPTRLLLAGPDDGCEAALRSLVSQLRLEEQVRFLGFVSSDERAYLLSASDLFALTSWSENFSYTAVEAMGAGLPVLLSEHVGIGREVEADGAGRVVPVQVDAIAEELRRLLSQPDLLKDMGRKAHASARKRYGIQEVAELMAMAYEDVLTGRRRPECQWSDIDG
ncbi:MAG: glycosyltransferase [Anaerolineae bacterium]